MRFNLFKKNEAEVVNYEGAKAYRLTPEMELFSAVVTAGLSDTFYEKCDDRITRLRELIAKNDAEFVARLAVYTRNQMYLRSVPMVLAVELARSEAGRQMVRRTVKGVVKRADEITELLAYYQVANERKGTKKLNRLSAQLRKGLGDVFNTFDEYQFAKYNRDAGVRLRDALFLVHPKAKDEAQQALFDRIAADQLAVPYTWETELSLLGTQKYDSDEARAAAVRAKWEELIASCKLGYMALLRNLRNIIEAEVSAESMDKVCTLIADSQAVARSKQLPFRFLSAYREIQKLSSTWVTRVLDALEDAVLASTANLRGFDSKTRVLLACDVSGSMQKSVSANSKVMYFDIGLVLAMLLQSKCRRVATGMFGSDWKIINTSGRGVLANADAYHKREGEVGYGTNGHKVIDDLIARGEVMDKVMMFTDCQLWDSRFAGDSLQRSWTGYKKIAPAARLYLFDLVGYGQSPLRVGENDVFFIAGWSDKVFEVLDAIENGGQAVAGVKQVIL
jgi:hypothetical protein